MAELRQASSQFEAVLVFVIVLLSSCSAEERALYLVIMEGDPVSFLGSSPSHKDGRHA